MEPSEIECGEAGPHAYGGGACEACSAYAYTQATKQTKRVAHGEDDNASCITQRIDARKGKSFRIEIARGRVDAQEEIAIEEEVRSFRKRIGTLHDQLPHQKECLPSLALGCILLLESRAG